MRPERCSRLLVLVLVLAPVPAGADALLSLRAGADVLSLGRADVAAIEASESGGITDVFLRLMPDATARMEAFTAEAVGRLMSVEVCGTRLLEAVVQDRVASGTIYVHGTTAVRAEALRAIWHGRARCDTLSPEVFSNGQ